MTEQHTRRVFKPALLRTPFSYKKGNTYNKEDFSMRITDIRIRKSNRNGKMRAIASVAFDNEFVVHDIKIIEGDKGLFIAMPSRKNINGEFHDIAHPISTDARERLQDAILEKYETDMSLSEVAASRYPHIKDNDA